MALRTPQTQRHEEEIGENRRANTSTKKGFLLTKTSSKRQVKVEIAEEADLKKK